MVTTAETPVLVTHTRLHEFIVDVLMAMKMERAPAEITAGHMVRTDLRGVDSHGIGMLPRYVEWWRDGYLQLDREPQVIRDDGAMALFDSRIRYFDNHPDVRRISALLAAAQAEYKVLTEGVDAVKRGDQKPSKDPQDPSKMAEVPASSPLYPAYMQFVNLRAPQGSGQRDADTGLPAAVTDPLDFCRGLPVKEG